MSANITAETFIASQEAAWWDTLGTAVAGYGRDLTLDEALLLSNSDYLVEESDVYNMIENEYVVIPNMKAIRRADNKYVFAVMSGRYEIIQNKEALAVADYLVKEGGYNFESCGNMNNGARVFATLRNPKDDYAVAGDEHRQHVSLVTSHDGTVNLVGGLSHIRIVCQNTWNMFLNEVKNGKKEGTFRFRHTTNVKSKIEDFKANLDFIRKHTNDLREQLEFLATRKLSAKAMKSFFELVLDMHDKEKEEISTQKRNNFELLETILETNVNNINPAYRYTAYDAANVISWYTDHEMGAKQSSGRNEAEARAWSSIFGTGQKLKQKAVKILLDRNGNEFEQEISNAELLDDMMAMTA